MCYAAASHGPEDDQNCCEIQQPWWHLFVFSETQLGNTFLDPESLKAKCMTASKLRNVSKANRNTILKIWNDVTLQSWAESKSHGLILVEGSSQSTGWLKQLSVQVIDRLDAKGPVIYIVNCATSREHFQQYDYMGLLKQLAIQGLRSITCPVSTAFIADMMHRFRHTTSTTDWMSILNQIIEASYNMCIVIDLSTLGSQVGNTIHWVNEFHNLLRHPTSINTSSVKVMFLSNRNLTKSNDPQITAVPISSCTRFRIDLGTNLDEAISSNKLTITGYDLRQTRNTPEQSDRVSCSPQETVPEMFQNASHSLLRGLDEGSCPKHRREDIKIAIVCALSLEADAIAPFWDEILDADQFSIPNVGANPISYSVVMIARHKAVILYMPAMGGFSAAYAFARCQAIFPGIQLAIISGICGGVPFPDKDIEVILGDVIISDGLITYDFGRQYPEGFQRKTEVADSARKMPPEISAFLSKLKTRWWRQKLLARTTHHLNAARRDPKFGDWAVYPGSKNDVLLGSRGPQRVEAADQSGHYVQLSAGRPVERPVHRKRLEILSKFEETGRPVHPAIHFGTYASGNKVMKSGAERDKVCQEANVMAFEMEGAGIWDQCPCIIVKGVCDYADHYKTKDWQKYAATAAAACVKAILEEWPRGI